MIHPNATLTPRGRLPLARRIVDGAARLLGRPSFSMCVVSHRQAVGDAVRGDEAAGIGRVGRAHAPLVVRRIVELRWRLSPMAMTSRLSMPPR
jgi:hypothetical protein